MPRRLSAFALLASALGASAGCDGCSKAPSIDALASTLASGGDVAHAVSRLPACTAREAGAAPACLGDVATALGSKSGFSMRAPNQATHAAAAVVLLRDHHGEWLVAPNDPGKADLGADVWLDAIAKGSGAGVDALRLAVARRMKESADAVGRSFDGEADARALMKAVAESIPGACPTYAALGAGTDDAALPVAMQADHAPCVQRDLSRAGGPGGVYGAGPMRAAKGASLLWREAADRLHQGCASLSSAAKTTCDADAAAIDAPTARLSVRDVETPTNGALYNMFAHADAGVDLDASAAVQPVRPVPDGGAKSRQK